MTPEPQSRGPAPDLDAEEEIDFGRYLRRVASRWWLLVIGAVAGVIIGFLVTTGTSRPYEAKAIVDLGTPFGVGGQTPIQNNPQRMARAIQMVDGRPTVAEVARTIGVSTSKLRANVSSQVVPGIVSGRIQQPSTLLEITVTGLPRKKEIQAANQLARKVATAFSSLADVKLRTYDQRKKRATRELGFVNQQIRDFQARQQELVNDRSIAGAEKLIILANTFNNLQFYETRQNNLESQLLTLDELIAQANLVEKARIAQSAEATRAAPPSKRTAAAIGGVIGLLLGILAALLWDPLAARRAARERA